MDQIDLARAVKVSRTTVSNWETGKSDPRNKLGKIYEVLGLNPDGQPKKSQTIGPDLQGMKVRDLIDLQNRLTAEIGRRLLAHEETAQQPATSNGHGAMRRPDLRKHLGPYRPDEDGGDQQVRAGE